MGANRDVDLNLGGVPCGQARRPGSEIATRGPAHRRDPVCVIALNLVVTKLR